MSLNKIAQLGRLAARIKWAQAPAPPAAAPPAAPAVPAPAPAVPAAPAAPAPAPAVPAPAPAALPWAGNRTFTQADIGEPPLGQRTEQLRAAYYRNAMMTHAYKRQNRIGVDPATGLVSDPYNLNSDQMRDLSHFMYPQAGHQYQLNKLQREGRPLPYANKLEYDAGMRQELSARAGNRQRLMDESNRLYPSGADNPYSDVSNIPRNSLNQLQTIASRSLQPPEPSSP